MIKNMAKHGLFSSVFVVCGILIYSLQGQILSRCPSGWIHFELQCYKFVSNSPKIFEEADSDCWQTYGATLLVINKRQEHTFISDWLFDNDAVFHSTWFTSGIYGNDVLLWEGDNSVTDIGDFWISRPHSNAIYNRVAYKYNGKTKIEYGWELTSSSKPANYICEIPQTDSLTIDLIHRDFGYGVGFVDPDSLPHGPRMIERPIGVVVFGNTAETIYLECDTHALPASEYQWFKGHQRNTSITSVTNTRYTLSGGRFTLERPKQVEDAGFYSCSAENNAGTIISSIVQIMFGYLHSFPPVKPDDQIGTAFEGVRLSCFTPAYSPAVKYAWFKFHTHNYIFTNHPYHFVSQSGYLYFSEVQPTDDRKYYCVVTLDAPDTMRPDSSIPPSKVSLGSTLIIRPGKTDSNYGPIIFTHVFPSPALKGSTIRLECVAYGSLPLSYKWHREGGRPMVKGTKITARNRVLTIPNAPLEAEGNYICTATRPGTSRTKTIVLVMEAKPYFANPLKNMLVDPGQNIKWRCKAVARPKATYSWYKNGKLIANVAGEIEAKQNVLIINNIDALRDEGMYQCAATNQHGTSFSSGQLKVLSFAPNFNRHPFQPYILGALGGNKTIQCRVEGAPLPQVEWLKNGGSLNLMAGQTDGHLGMSLKNDLVLTQIEASDQGTYTCKATNGNGEAQNSTFMEVVPGIAIDHPPVDSTVTVNRTAFMYCSASYNQNRMDLVYEWKFNGHLIDFSTNNHYVKGISQGVRGLYVRAAQYTQGGVYTCVARTPLHSNSKSAILSVNGPPGIPAGVYTDAASVTSYSVRVIWTIGPKTDHGAPIIGYDIEADTNFAPGQWEILQSDVDEIVTLTEATAQSKRSDQRAVVVDNLVPNTEYRFRIRAINEYGRGQAASKPCASVKTPATPPTIAPTGLSGGDGKVGTLNMSWTPLPPSQQCGSGIGYNLYWKLYAKHKLTWKQTTIHGNIGGYTALVGVDNYYLKYEVKVGAFNDYGDGPNSTSEIIYSAMGLPVAVPTITGVNGINLTTVQVTFDPLPNDREHIKGKIGGYTIQYYVNDLGCNPMSGCEPTNLKWRYIWGQASEVTLIDLELNAEYFFRMQVFNSAGWGPKGEWRRGETATYAPLQYPRFVRVRSNGQHSVIVNWQGVMTTNNEEIITGYKVKVWEVQSDIRSANESTSDRLQTQVTLYGLQTRTVYQLRVQGMSAGGDGAMSNSVYFTVLGGQVRIDPASTQICYEGITCNSAYSHLPSLILLCIFTFIISLLLNNL